MTEMIKKLMAVDSYSDGASTWRVACDCQDPDHDVNLYFEPEPDFDQVNLHLEMEIGFRSRYNMTWLGDKWARIKHAAKVLSTGYVTMRGDVVLDKDGIIAMRTALDKAMAHVKKTQGR